MTMSKSLVSCLGVKVSQLKVMCGLSLDSAAREERAVNEVVSDPIPSAKFLQAYRQKRNAKHFAIEFKALSRNQEEHSTNAALRNILLNNKQEVVPYDHSRVIVWDRPEDLGTDYYNASYIDGYNGPREYIVSQGPSTKCIVSFWHMVWQEGITCIVMATGLFENAMQQCDKYWVDKTRKYAKHGKIHIWHEGSTYLAQLNIRTFRIQKEGSCESRLLTHYEMVGFHDEAPDPGLLLDVRRRVNSLSGIQPGPVLVHCRCGGGRTAVYVAIDYCLQQLQSEDRVDVYSTVLHLRRFRKNMVRTVGQYQQIYEAVAMYLQCGVTVYPIHTLVAAYQVHYGCDSKLMTLDREYQTLHAIVPRLSIGDCASGHRVENRSKSRDIMMLPPECARPYLTTADCGDSGTDFINAVYIDGYHAENSYLITQWPMRRTIADLWRLMFDFKITSLVFMNDPPKFSRNYPRFWPKEIDQVANYGPISVRYLNCERLNHIVTRTFAIRKGYYMFASLLPQPKRHPHLIAQALMRISEDVMIMNNLVGCEVRQDEVVVKMFQVLSSGCDSGDRGRPSHGSGRSRGSVDDGQGDGDRGHSGYRGVGIMSKSLLSVMEHVADWQKRSNNRQPVCIISKDGCSRVGLYCAISICCDQVRVEKEVDVFNAVRMVRKNRPQLVPTIEEYRYIYHFMTEFILLSASKPDIIISEPPADYIPHTGSLHRIATCPTTIASTLHGGVYVVAVGKKTDNSENSREGVPSKSEGASCVKCSHNSAREFQPFGVSQSRSFQGSRKNQNGGYCGLELSTNSGEQTENGLLTLPCCSHSNQHHSDHNTTKMHLAGSTTRKNLFGKTTYESNSTANGLILSASTLLPVGDLHQTASNNSIIGLSQNQTVCLSSSSVSNPSPDLNVIPCLYPPLHSSTYSYLPSPLSPSPLLSSKLSPPFLSPDVFRSGKESSPTTSRTNQSPSPGSLCRSSSFFSCNSQVSNLGESIFQNSLGNGGLPSSDLTNSILHHAANSNGLTSPNSLHLNHRHLSGGNGAPSVSVTFNSDVTKTTSELSALADSADIKLIHASYASLDDSSSGSDDDYDINSSLDWVQNDDGGDSHYRQHKFKKDAPVVPNHCVIRNGHGLRNTLSSASSPPLTAYSNKGPSSSLKQRIKCCRYRKKSKIQTSL